MEVTCTYPKCAHAKLMEQLAEAAGVKTEFPRECVNYVEAWWKNEKDGEQKLITDCAPRRTLMMVQDLYNRQIGLQKAQEEQRNTTAEAMKGINCIGMMIARRLNNADREALSGNGRTLIEGKPS